MISRRKLLRGASLGVPLWLARHAAFGQELPPAGGMITHQRVPHNAEPPLGQLVKQWMTPTEWFYVRSHGPVPQIDVKSFRLSVEGLVDKPLMLSLEQLQRQFPRQSVVATLTCAGNRRHEHSRVKPVSGVAWQAGAIGNAQWAGVRLSDLLQRAGVQNSAKHVWFEGLDEIEAEGGAISFGASIPLEKAHADAESMPGALVAYEMNGDPLTLDHGFPLRTVVPGFIGARSVKWLARIVVADRPSTNHYVASAYKLVTEDDRDQWSAAAPLDVYAMNSVTCVPSARAKLRAGRVVAQGYALARGLADRGIAKVEMSTDGGHVWTSAKLAGEKRPFCWRLWNAEVDVNADTTELVVRAIDSSGEMQPEQVAWNLKGYNFNAWHRTPLEVE